MPVTGRKTGDFTTHGQIYRLSGLALIVGTICAFIAIALLKLIGLVTNLSFYHRWSFSFATPAHNHLGPWVIAIPVVGGLIIGLIAKYGSEKIRGHGIPEAIEAMLVNESKVHPRVAFWKPISAAISIGTGGPFGAEGPIIMTGGSMGSLLSQCFHLSSIERRILLVAGAAGGMSATFAAPVASVLFAVELLVFEFKPRSLVPIALASAIADVIRTIIMGGGPLFAMPMLAHVSVQMALVAAAMGIVGCLLAVLLTGAIYGLEDLFRKLPIHWMWWPALGGVVIGIGGLVSPQALGVGYSSIAAMLNNRITLSALILLLLVKTVIWVVALGSGTSGGILAPILIIGGCFGGVAADVFHAPHPGMWALLGMSAIFAGVTRTPMTSIIFPLELTHNLGAMLPLLITSCVAYGLSSLILRRSILTEKIARRGLHLTREYSVDPLQMRYAREFAYIPSHSTSSDVRISKVASQFMADESGDPWLSVQSKDGTWIGVVHRMDVYRQALQNPDMPVSDCLLLVPTIREEDTLAIGLDVMLNAQARWVRVLKHDGTNLGALTAERLFQVRVQAWQSENHRHKVFGKIAPVVQDIQPASANVDTTPVEYQNLSG